MNFHYLLSSKENENDKENDKIYRLCSLHINQLPIYLDSQILHVSLPILICLRLALMTLKPRPVKISIND